MGCPAETTLQGVQQRKVPDRIEVDQGKSQFEGLRRGRCQLLFGLGCLLIGFVVYSVRTGANDWFWSDRVERGAGESRRQLFGPGLLESLRFGTEATRAALRPSPEASSVR